MTNQKIQERTINAIRFLSADAIQKANSGHPGLPMGTAAMAYTIWAKHLKFDPKHVNWADRDRFVLSAGHGSMLLYSLLHLFGYDLSMQELKRFRQWESLTPGHPEYGLTPGVEMTTGPLGQGISSAVGMAIGVEHIAAQFNKPDLTIVDHDIYVIASDGDLMEGVASEAASLAGHLKLGRLIVLYDDNRISIDGSTDLAFSEDCAARFAAYGWQVLHADGNNVDEIDAAIMAAKSDERPSIIICRTHIGYGLPTKQDTSSAHGEPPGDEELDAAKQALGWPTEPRFLVPDDVKVHLQSITTQGQQRYAEWSELFDSYRQSYAAEAAEFERRMAGELPEGLAANVPVFPTDAKGLASRVSSGKIINALAQVLPEFMGGSADLTGSNKTGINGEKSFGPDDRSGRYLHYGVREHAMGAVMNGLVLHGGMIPFGGTFLVFSDYMRPAMRLAALMDLRVIYVLTHDSIGLGEDGPTHQPVEHMAALRAIPNLAVFRPADANETAQSWLAALKRTHGPSVLALSRQALPTVDRTKFGAAEGVHQGAYVLAEYGSNPDVVLMASGSEVPIMLDAAQMLDAQGIAVRVVSFPCWELFEEQSNEYQQSVLLPSARLHIAMEAGVSQGWHRWVGTDGVIIGVDRFGASAPFQELYQNLGLTPEHVLAVVQDRLQA